MCFRYFLLLLPLLRIIFWFGCIDSPSKNCSLVDHNHPEKLPYIWMMNESRVGKSVFDNVEHKFRKLFVWISFDTSKSQPGSSKFRMYNFVHIMNHILNCSYAEIAIIFCVLFFLLIWVCSVDREQRIWMDTICSNVVMLVFPYVAVKPAVSCIYSFDTVFVYAFVLVDVVVVFVFFFLLCPLSLQKVTLHSGKYLKSVLKQIQSTWKFFFVICF